MRARFVALAITALLAIGSGLGHGALALDHVPTTPLGLNNTISGNHMAKLGVLVSRSATLSLKEVGGDITISGGGRFAGFLLKAATGSPVDLIALNYNGCPQPGCTPTDPQPIYWVEQSASPLMSYTLHPGRYTLYFFADTAQVTIKLTLHGLTGKTAIRPWVYADGTFLHPTEVDPGGLHQAYSSGVSLSSGPQGRLVIESEFVTWKAAYVGVTGLCLYNTPPPQGLLFTPGCPQAAQNYFFLNTLESTSSQAVGIVTFTPIMAAGNYSIGLYADGAGVIQAASSFFFVTDY